MNDIFILPLSNSDKVCVIDACLASIILSMDRAWSITGSGGCIYCSNKSKATYLHKTIFNFFQENTYRGEVDHANRNFLDNRESNLRKATQSQNGYNKKKRIGNYSSKYKGVSWIKKLKKWKVSITINKKLICGGYFSCEGDAARKYNELALTHQGEFAVINIL